jgi:carbon monoxide dehydrogenase subunit G
MADVVISRSVTVHVPRERLWTALRDPYVLAPCVPILDSLERLGEDHYALGVVIPAPVIGGKYRGTVRFIEVSPEERFRLLVNGAGRLGRVQANADIVLRSRGESSDVDVTIRAGTDCSLPRAVQSPDVVGPTIFVPMTALASPPRHKSTREIGRHRKASGAGQTRENTEYTRQANTCTMQA